METLKFLFVSFVTFIVIVFVGYYYLEPENAKSFITSLPENISSFSINDLKNISLRDLFPQRQNDEIVDSAYWTLFTNNDFGVSFKYPPTQTEILEHKEKPYSVTVYLPDTISNKIKRNFTVAVFDPDYCAYNTSTSTLPKNAKRRTYNKLPYVFYSEKIPDTDAVTRSFVSYTINGSYCYVFDMKYMKAKEDSSDEYGLKTDFGDNYEELGLYENIMRTVKIF